MEAMSNEFIWENDRQQGVRIHNQTHISCFPLQIQGKQKNKQDIENIPLILSVLSMYIDGYISWSYQMTYIFP